MLIDNLELPEYTTEPKRSNQLVPIKEASDYAKNWFFYLIHQRIVAIDEIGGFALQPTRGRGKGGISHYVLVEYDFITHKFGNNGRIGSKIAAWDDNEAIAIANKRLAKKVKG